MHGCEWLAEEQKGRHFRFPNTGDGWATFLRQLDRECWVALEVAGNAFEVHDLLSPHVGRVLLANPVELKRLGSGRHTDRVDAERLAKMLALGGYCPRCGCRRRRFAACGGCSSTATGWSGTGGAA